MEIFYIEKLTPTENQRQRRDQYRKKEKKAMKTSAQVHLHWQNTESRDGWTYSRGITTVLEFGVCGFFCPTFKFANNHRETY